MFLRESAQASAKATALVRLRYLGCFDFLVVLGPKRTMLQVQDPLAQSDRHGTGGGLAAAGKDGGVIVANNYAQ
jgi:hypothetical protein